MISGPKWRVLADEIEADIRSGRRAPGERLPSHADLQRDLGISQTVTLRAYNHLSDRGLVVSSHGTGTHVAEVIPPPDLDPLDDIRKQVAELTRRLDAHESRRRHGLAARTNEEPPSVHRG